MPPARDCIPRRAGPILLLSLVLVEFLALLALNVLGWVLASTGSIAVTLAAPFLLYFALDACWKKNSIQLIALFLFNTALLVYVVLQFVETRAKNTGFGWVTFAGDWTALDDILSGVQLAVVTVAEVLLVGAGWMCFREYRWTVFTVIGNESRLCTAFRDYHIYLCFLKLTFFFIIYQIVTQFTGSLRSGTFISPFLGLIIDVVICIVLVLEWVGLRWEKRWLLWTILFFNILATAWLALAVIALDYSVHNYNSRSNYRSQINPYSSPAQDLPAIKYSSLIWYHFTLALYLARFILSCVCWHRVPRGIYDYNVQNNLRRQGGEGGDTIAMEEARGLSVAGPIAGDAREVQYEGLPLGEERSPVFGVERGNRSFVGERGGLMGGAEAGPSGYRDEIQHAR